MTYEIVTPESAVDGDAEDMGVLDSGLSLRDAVKLVFATRTNEVDGVLAVEPNCSHGKVAWITVQNGMEYRTGAYESRGLHIPRTVTSASSRRLVRLLNRS